MNTQAVSFTGVLRWTDDECRAYLEAKRWPNGAVCPKCGATEPYRLTRKTKTKNHIKSIYKCRKCRQQFTVTVGTIFEDSKIPLSKWFAAIYLMCASKKGVSAHQIHRQLDITYKPAWFMCHRIREAMRDKTLEPLTGTIEADETYVGGKQRGHPNDRERLQDEIAMGWREKPAHPRMEKAIVLGMVERDGNARTQVIPDTTAQTVNPIFRKNINLKEAHLITDAHKAYKHMKNYLPHDTIRHEDRYVDGDIHIQGMENYWSLLKRGIVGTFHHVSKEHLTSYLDEFEFRFNHRKIEDEARFAALMRQTEGRLRWYF